MTTNLINSEGCTPSDVLDGAAEIMEEWGFVKQEFVCMDGKVCEEGAVLAAAGKHVHYLYEVNFQTKWRFLPLYVGSNIPKLDEEGRIISGVFSGMWRDSDDLVANKALAILRDVGGGTTHNDRRGNTFQKSVAKLREAAESARAQGL